MPALFSANRGREDILVMQRVYTTLSVEEEGILRGGYLSTRAKRW
jgi:hypothetical protein